jgi:hypothetical protein
MGLTVGPDTFGLRRRRSLFPYSRYARSFLLGSLQNRHGQLYRLFRDEPLAKNLDSEYSTGQNSI